MESLSDVDKLYSQTLEFLKDEDPGAGLTNPGPTLTEHQTILRTVSENYLLKDNLLLLWKNV